MYRTVHGRGEVEKKTVTSFRTTKQPDVGFEIRAVLSSAALLVDGSPGETHLWRQFNVNVDSPLRTVLVKLSP